MNQTARFRFDNSYARELVGCYVPWQPSTVRAPRLLFLNDALAKELGLDPSAHDADGWAEILSGNALPEDAEPLAQAYAGHQFGGFSPQLGDGRALLLGEVIDREGRRRDIAFKGSGRTPFARNGDGKAAVGPMLREVLIGEAMHALGIPTTRALAVVATGEPVHREQTLPGAVLTRVAASHLRVGTFEYFAARGDIERLRKLAEYAIARHYPELAGGTEPFLALLRAVAERQASLIARWMNVGFIHGVMNTDNVAISGETIDFGPCAFMEAYDPRTVFSSIDRGGRYAFGNQPDVAHWNLARLAEALLPLIADEAEQAVALATDALAAFPQAYRREWLNGQRAKLGLARSTPVDEGADAALVADWLALLHAERVDFTLAWRRLAEVVAGDATPLRALFTDPRAPDAWLSRWRARCAREDGRATAHAPMTSAARAAAMRRVNPLVIPRNHRVEEALAAASDLGDLAPFERLLDALRHPYDEAPTRNHYAEPAPAHVTARYQTFCGT
jgi:uncharacterized protein YdiU (UPF0061 family)